MFRVDISPAAKEVISRYAGYCARDNGTECALRFLDAYDEKISFLQAQPQIGCARLKYIPGKYRVLNFWPHLWFVFQIYENSREVKIEYIIDDRQNYGPFIR